MKAARENNAREQKPPGKQGSSTARASIGGEDKQGLLTSLPFWSLEQLGKTPKEIPKQHLKLKPQLKQNTHF